MMREYYRESKVKAKPGNVERGPSKSTAILCVIYLAANIVDSDPGFEAHPNGIMCLSLSVCLSTFICLSLIHT